jgi:hypothetical protein
MQEESQTTPNKDAETDRQYDKAEARSLPNSEADSRITPLAFPTGYEFYRRFYEGQKRT